MKKHDVEQIIKAFSKKYGKQAKEIENAIRKAMANGMSIAEAVKEATKETEAWMTSHVMESMLLSVSAGSGVNFEELPPALTNAWDASGMKLSKKIHGTTKEMRSAIISTLCKAQKDGKKVIETARALYDGYGYGHVTRTQPLPDYLDKVLTYARRMDLSDKDKDALMREIRNAKRVTERLSQNNAPNRTLKAVYKELVTHIERSEDRMMERSLKAAVEEKSRYIAERIARTESARAWADGFIARYGDDEDVVAYRWKTGSRHPEEDICDMYANANLWNLGKGIFPKDKCPFLPIHPHCLCHLAPVFISEVDIDNAQDQRDTAACDWLKRQNENTRENLLGVKGNKAWEEGRKTWRTVLRNYSPKVMKSRIVGERGITGKKEKGDIIRRVDRKYIHSREFDNKFNKLSNPPEVNKQLKTCARKALLNNDGTTNEDLYLIHAKTGKLLGKIVGYDYAKGALYTRELKEIINRNKGSIITLHSHPNNNPPTGSDLLSAAIHGHKKGYVVTIAGDLHEYELLKRDEGAYRAFGVFDRKVAEERERVYNKDKIQAIRKTLKKLSGVVLWKEVK